MQQITKRVFVSKTAKWGLVLLLAALWGNAGSPAFLQAKDKSTEKAKPVESTGVEMLPREQAFVDQMHKTVLVGFFTLADEKNGQGGKPERYEIRQVSKVKDNLWMFQTRIKYGKVDTIMPLVLPVEWAGETPVISMTDFTIPGMGTFSCRVLFHKDRYAGTWQHGEKGGHMWGLIEKVQD